MRRYKHERDYQADLIKKLKLIFPGCVVLKNDSGYKQGIPDLLILWQHRWAALEVKLTADSPHQPNQDYYIDIWNKMSFASFIYPENEQEVLDAIFRSFET